MSSTTGDPYTFQTTGVTTTTPNTTITWPINQPYYTSTWGYSYSPPVHAYYILQVELNKMPYKVYVDGRLLTLGAFGTDVECAFAKNRKLIFDSQVLSVAQRLSVEYKDCIYHYKLRVVDGNLCKEDTRILNSQLLSIINNK